MLLLAVAAVVPLRFGLRSDRGMVGCWQQLECNCRVPFEISVELEEGQDTGWIISSEMHTQLSGKIFVISEMCAVSSTSFQVDLT